jgi:predicted nucleic acid-binding protein
MNMAGSVLVDTNVVVAYFRGDMTLQPHFAGITPLYLPWVVLGELHFGAQRAQRRQEQLAYIHDLLTYAVVLFPDQDTEVYGQVKAELAQLGIAHSGQRPLDCGDGQAVRPAAGNQGRPLHPCAAIEDPRVVAPSTQRPKRIERPGDPAEACSTLFQKVYVRGRTSACVVPF